MINRALQPIGLRLVRAGAAVAGPVNPSPGDPFNRPPLDDGWAAERAYWEVQIRAYYRTQFGVELSPLQTDPRIIPPAELGRSIQGLNKADPDGFFASGYRTTLSYLTELREHGRSPAEMSRILEMGVGFGRLLVHYSPFQAELHGCDVTPKVLEWTRKCLGHRASLKLTGLEPPLPYPDQHFDFVYANSVFTHIDSPLVGRWAAELYRITRSGGMAIVSVLDPNHYLRHLTFRDYHARCHLPGCVTWNADKGVLMLTYQTPEHLSATFGRAGFQILELRSHYRDQRHLICRRRS